MSKTQEYGNIVEQFIQQKLKEDPNATQEILDKYPVVSRKRWQLFRKREITSGLNPFNEEYEEEE